MGTTGGDSEQLLADVQAAGTFAVIAPNMGKQVSFSDEPGCQASVGHSCRLLAHGGG
jgi:hypothetical protein